MSYAFTSSTAYPSFLTVPESHLAVLDSFFHIVDSIVNDSPSCSQEFTKVFTPNGVWKTPSRIFDGLEEIVKSGTTWEHFKKFRYFRHSVVEVFGIDAQGKTLMLLGEVETEVLDGKRAKYPFSARVEIDDSGPEPKLKYFQGWSSGF